MKTKEELFEELTPIEFYNLYDPTHIKKQLKNWTKTGLEVMKKLWHMYYTNTAHRLICVCIMNYKEKDIIWTNFEIALMES